MLKRMRLVPSGCWRGSFWHIWWFPSILWSIFFPGTTVNGESADLLTVREANGLILDQAKGYELTLLERGGSEEILTAEQLGMSFSETDNVRKYMRIQNGFLWPRMFWQQDSYQIVPDITFDDDTWDDTLSALSCIQEGAAPEDAWVELTGRWL